MHGFFNQFGVHISKTVDQIKDSLYSVWNYEMLYIDNLNESIAKVNK